MDVQKPPGVCYNGDGIMVMTSREITHFSSDIPAFILCATVFICEEFHKIVCGDGFWLCYEWGQDQQNKQPTLFPPILALINYKMCSHVEHYLRKLKCCMLFVPHLQVPKCHRVFWDSSCNKNTSLVQQRGLRSR